MIRSLLTVCIFIVTLCVFATAQTTTHDHSLKIEVNINNVNQSLTSGNRTADGQARFSINLPQGACDFTAIPNQIMSPEFKAENPEIMTYDILSIDGSYKGKLTLNKQELFITMHGPSGLMHIAPDKHSDSYIVEDKYHRVLPDGIHMDGCGNDKEFANSSSDVSNQVVNSSKFVNTLEYGDLIRTYRMAIVCTGEYYQANGNNPTLVRTQITSTVASLEEIYSNDLSVRFSLLTPRLYSDPDNDPFTPDELPGASSRPTQASQQVNMVFNEPDYDIGHVLHETTSGDNWSGGGVAQLRSVCRDGSKAAGWSGSFNTRTLSFVFLFAHEIGHMFGAQHTFNGDESNCTDAISDDTAYEIASGTTIMSYNGICGADWNIPLNGDTAEEDHFHVHSLTQMIDHIANFSACPATVASNNAIPEVDADPCDLGGEYEVPRRTPYFINGTATDADLGDVLSYSWEQYDEDGTGTPTQGFIGNQAANSMTAPQIRNRAPREDGLRYIPSRENVLGNVVDAFEVNSNVRRDINMRLVVRDNEGAFGVDDFIVKTAGTGPFRLLSPTGGENLIAGDQIPITWSTGGSEALCSLVDIKLSLDGGNTYPLTIVEGINYADLSYNYTLPPGLTSSDRARVMISCADNPCMQFYSVSRLDFSISSDCIAQSSSLCDTTGITANAGDSLLDLNISSVSGNLVDGDLFLQVSNTSELLPLAAYAPTSNACSVVLNSRRSVSTFIEVGNDGDYLFDMDYDFQGNFSFVSIFREDLFSAGNICASFVGSTVRQSSAGGTSVFRVTDEIALEACVTYRIVAYSFDTGTVNVKLNGITGDGLVFTDQTLDPDYSYAYLAVNKATGKIAAYDDMGDFTALLAGNYEVYGFTYKSAGATPPQILDLTTLIGKDIFEVATDGDCIKVSDDFMRVDVETSCIITDVSVGNQSNCNPSDNTYTQELILTYELPPAGSRIIVNGQAFDLSSSPQVITLVGLPSDGNPVTINAFFEDDPICGTELTELFMAPENCCPIDIPFSASSVACQGEPLILDAGMDGMTYEWFLDGGPLANVNATFNATAVGTYSVIVTTASGCAKSAETIVSFEDNPSLSTVDDATICDTESYDFMISTNADSVTILLGGAVNQINPTTFSVTEAGMYSVVASSENGCETTEEFDLSTVESPTPDLGLDVQACTGDMVMLDAGADGISYIWTRDGANVMNNNRQLEVSTGGQYIVSVENMDMCIGMDTVEVSFTDNPTIEFTNTDPRFCSGGSIPLEVNSSATDISWTLNGTSFTPTSVNLHEADMPGNYMVVASFGPSCQAETSIMVSEVEQAAFDLPETMIISCIGSDVMQTIPITADAYEWLKDGLFFSDQASVTITETGVYTASAINGGLCFDTEDVSVEFVDGPMVDLQGEQEFCAGGNTILTVTTNGTSIEWYLDGNQIMGETDNTLVAVTEGQYQVQVSGTANCIAESTIEVIENPLPELELGDDQTICLGESVELNAATGNMGDVYTWTRDGVAFSTDPQVSIIESGIYELTIQNISDCSDSDALSVTVLNPPTLSIMAPPSICEGDTEVIAVTSNATEFVWSLDGNVISGETDNSITINQGGTYTVEASSTGLCSIEDMVTVDNISLPIVDLGMDSDLCPGQNLSLSAGNHTSYLWSDNSTDPTLQIDNDNVAVVTTETYGVTVTNISGCENQDEINVTLLPVVMAEINAPADGVCEDGSLVLTATGGTAYQWSGPAGTIDDPSSASVEVSPSEASSYAVLVSDGCPGNEDTASIDLEVFTAAAITAGPDTCIVIGQEYAMQASGGAFYRWDNTETIIGSNNVPDAIVSPEMTTTYTVEVTDENGCLYEDQVDICVIEDPLEIFKAVNVITPNDDGKNDALIFPGLEAFPDNNLAVFNRWGNLIFEKTGYQINGELWDGTEGGETLPPDVYYYILEFGGFTIKSSITLLQD